MIIAIFDTNTGDCLEVHSGAAFNLSDYSLAKELSEYAEVDSIWYNSSSNSVVTRTEVSLAIPDTASVGDTVQTAIPVGCYAKVNNIKQTDNIVINTSQPGRFNVKL